MLLVYALSCFGQEKLTLKAKQEEVLTNLYDGYGLCLVSYGIRQVFVLTYQLLPFLLDFNLKLTCSS